MSTNVEVNIFSQMTSNEILKSSLNFGAFSGRLNSQKVSVAIFSLARVKFVLYCDFKFTGDSIILRRLALMRNV